jgi:hypothetical protein
VIVMPAGPGEDVADTLESVRAYTDPSRAVVVVDDSRTPALAQRLSGDRDVLVVPAPAGAEGSRGGLWVKLAAGYRAAVERFTFDVLLRMDADALLLRPGIEHAALDRFAVSPGVGMLGSYRVGPDGAARDFAPAAAILEAECGARGLRHPSLRRTLRHVRAAAEDRGYVAGAHPLGGAYIHSPDAVRALLDAGLLDLPVLARSRLGEDHLFAMLTVAAGYGIDDFGGPGQPLALRWIGLPDHPDALLAGDAMVTHSVRSWGDLDESAVRALFRAARRNTAGAGDSATPAGGR